jgi:hypothetical protein
LRIVIKTPLLQINHEVDTNGCEQAVMPPWQTATDKNISACE